MPTLGSTTLWHVLTATTLAAITASSIGTLILLQKKPLAGDAIAHALLPGLCIAFRLTGQKSTIPLLIGALLAGTLASYTLEKIPQYTKIKQDTAIALVLSLFFGTGLLFLTHLQHTGNAQQVGLQHFLLGNAASIQQHDLITFTTIATTLLLTLTLTLRAFKTLLFDRPFTTTIGWPITTLDHLLRTLFVATLIVGMHSIGIILMTAMLIAPPAAARFWTHHLHHILLTAALFATTSSTIGTLLSSHITKLPTGPAIVLTMALITLLSFLLAPQKGLIAKKYAQHRYRNKIVQENILKRLYTLHQQHPHPPTSYPLNLLLHQYPIPKTKMLHALRTLTHKKLIQEKTPLTWTLTPTGKAQGKEILRLHLLWEAYLIQYLHIAPDHVHEDAEAIEHLLTPALKTELQQLIQKKHPKNNHQAQYPRQSNPHKDEHNPKPHPL